MIHADPILVGPLLHEVCGELHQLLRSLTPDDWDRPTISSRRQVRDIVSHLLDGSLRRLSTQRDSHRPTARPSEATSSEPLLDYLNRLNAEWEQSTRRLSPAVLIELLEGADRQFADFMNSLDPFAPAIFPVAWAGENTSQNWFDVARDYTEKWHHTQQIFEATNRPSTILTRRLYHPCLETFLRALPYTFRDVPADEGATVAVEIPGDAGGIWQIARRPTGWQFTEPSQAATARCVVPPEIAWKVFTKRLPIETKLAALPGIRVEGDPRLGQHVLEMVSVMA